MEPQTVAERLTGVRQRISGACERSGRSPEEVTLIAVTKGFPASVVLEALDAGITNIGENRLQEAQPKFAELAATPSSALKHMVGHLQTNKVKAVVALFDIIHAVDSLHLAEVISRRAQHPFPIFLEVNVAGESSKFGFSLEELSSVLPSVAALPNLDVRGLMTVAPIAEDPDEVRPIFRSLRESAQGLGLGELSMGMTNDFEIAIEEGATHVRIGRALFGERG